MADGIEVEIEVACSLDGVRFVTDCETELQVWRTKLLLNEGLERFKVMEDVEVLVA